MSGIPTIALDDLMVPTSGSIDPSRFPDEAFELYSIPAFDNGRPELSLGREIGSSKQVVQPNDVLLSRIVPHVRRAWVVGKQRGCRQIASGEWIVFRSAKTHPSYLRYLLVEDRFHAQFMKTVAGVGGSLLRARPAHVADIEVPFPSLSGQRRIAERLEQADRLRRTRRYALELTDNFLPAAFLELFGDPFAVPPTELARLEDVLEVDPQNGLYVPADRYVSNGDPKGTEMVHMSDLFGGIVTPGNLKRALLETSEVAKYQLSDRDLLVARRSLVYDGAAQPCRVPALKTPLVFESSMIRIRPDRSRMLAVYLCYYLTNRAVRENRVRRYVTISTISGINQDNLCRIEVVVPPLPLQQKFAALVERVERLRAVQCEALRQAEHLFAALLARSFGADSPSEPGNSLPGN